MGSKFYPNPYNGTGWESPLNGVGSNFIPSQLSGNRKFSQPNPLSRGLVFPARISHPGGHTNKDSNKDSNNNSNEDSNKDGNKDDNEKDGNEDDDDKDGNEDEDEDEDNPLPLPPT